MQCDDSNLTLKPPDITDNSQEFPKLIVHHEVEIQYDNLDGSLNTGSNRKQRSIDPSGSSQTKKHHSIKLYDSNDKGSFKVLIVSKSGVNIYTMKVG